jgi:hypothetical protein
MQRKKPRPKPERRFRGPRLPADPIKLTLTEGASRQVDAAIDALERGDFAVAVTLAGAAEGMPPATATIYLPSCGTIPVPKRGLPRRRTGSACLTESATG